MGPTTLMFVARNSAEAAWAEAELGAGSRRQSRWGLGRIFFAATGAAGDFME